MIISDIIKGIILMISKNDNHFKIYSPTKAIIGAVFYTSFFLTLTISMFGFPEKPINIQIRDTNITIGKTKASYLLDKGFTFKDKTQNSLIKNKRDDHFYYGEFVELIYEDKSYGHMCITPIWKDVDILKDCIITFYEIKADTNNLSQIKFNNIPLSSLTITDFKTKDLIDVFSLKPADYRETKNISSFILRLQTAGYMLWKSYHIEIDFTPDNLPYRYRIGAQHTIWE